MPVYVTRTVTGPDGTERTLTDRDILATLTGYSARTIRHYCKPEKIDPETQRALYHQDTVTTLLEARGCFPRPHMQRPRAKKTGPAIRRRKP